MKNRFEPATGKAFKDPVSEAGMKFLVFKDIPQTSSDIYQVDAKLSRRSSNSLN